MAISKLQAGAAGLLGLALLAGLWQQHRDNARLHSENEGLRRQVAEVAALRRENQRVATENASPARALRLLPPGEPGGPAMSPGSFSTPVASGKFNLTFNNEDPEMNRLMDIQLKGQLDSRYGALFKMLNLDPAQQEQLRKLLLERQNVTRDVLAAAKGQGLSPADTEGGLPAMVDRTNREIDDRINQLLGDDSYARYQQYQDTLPQRSLTDQLASRLNSSATPLTSEQTEQLVQILAANPVPASPDAVAVGANQVFARGSNGATWVNGAVRMAMFTNANSVSNGAIGPGLGGSTVSDAALAQAQEILAPAQMDALRQIQAEQQASHALAQHMMQTITTGGN